MGPRKTESLCINTILQAPRKDQQLLREEEEEAGPCAHGREQDVAGTVHDRGLEQRQVNIELSSS